MRRLSLTRMLTAIKPAATLAVATPLVAVMIVAVTLVAFVPSLNAQRIGASSARFASSFNRGRHSRASFYPLGLSDPLYSDYLSAGYPVASQPPVVIMQASPSSAPAPDRFSQPVQPLMIELQGDRYVQVSSAQTPGAEMIPQAQKNEETDPSQVRSGHQSSHSVHAVTAPELPAAVLIFRDGHNEEASDYTIADGILYARGDPYNGGSWNRKIALSLLNLPQTIATNSSHGVKFQLPASPNEVIVGP
jgi:hypothetical protein